MKLQHHSPHKLNFNELQTNICSWGGFTSEFISFVPIVDDMPDWLSNMWIKDLTQHHNAQMIQNIYDVEFVNDVKNYSYKELFELGSKSFHDDTVSDFLKNELKIYITTTSDGYICELRVYDLSILKLK